MPMHERPYIKTASHKSMARSFLPSCGCGSVSILVFTAYLAVTIRSFLTIMFPMRGVEIDRSAPLLQPLWPKDTRVFVKCFVSPNAKFNLEFLNASSAEAVYSPLVGNRALNTTYSPGMPSKKLEVDITTERLLEKERRAEEEEERTGKGTKKRRRKKKQGGERERVILPQVIWDDYLLKGRPLFLHVWVTGGKEDTGGIGDHRVFDDLMVMTQTVPLTIKAPPPKLKPKRKLLSQSATEGEDAYRQQLKATPADVDITYWGSDVSLKLVADWTEYPENLVPVTVRSQMDIRGLDSEGGPVYNARHRGDYERMAYMPPLYLGEAAKDTLMPVNSTLTELPLSITLEALSLPRWQLSLHFMYVLSSNKEKLGLEDKDLEELRQLFTETNVTLLFVTLLASLLHLLFEFLAFRADVSFWRKEKTMAGLSFRAIALDLVFQAVILLYLIDEGSSLLISVPAGIGLIIQAWKTVKAMRIRRNRAEKAAKREEQATTKVTDVDHNTEGKDGAETTEAEGSREKEKEEETVIAQTLEADRIAMNNLGLVLMPIVVGFALKSLLTDEHVGWYSWALGATTSFVYTVGFILMTPQLYINHKLKSVAHLPWKFLCYRFLNTFIDDLFAFIIKMPMMHRISCLRDDIVFFIFVYQRFKYPVDKKRINEFGGHG